MNKKQHAYYIDEDSYPLFNTPNHTGSPERRLLLAILERAILDYVGNNSHEVEEAEEWIFADHANLTSPQFSFRWICQELDLDPSQVTDTIEAMPKRGKHKVAPWYFTRAGYDAALSGVETRMSA